MTAWRAILPVCRVQLDGEAGSRRTGSRLGRRRFGVQHDDILYAGNQCQHHAHPTPLSRLWATLVMSHAWCFSPQPSQAL